jgi:cellulose synthase/poly-beta-1,6-N-acetylglucosamine synthase-like glycosyltransferase
MLPTAAEPLQVSEEERQARLHAARFGLLEKDPELSAKSTLSRQQKRWILGVVVSIVLGFVLFGHNAVIVLVSIAVALYGATVLFRLRLFRLSASTAAVPEISEAQAMSIPEDELPVYTVMIPAFGEPNVVAKLIDSVGRLRYPSHLLDMKLLLEEDDTETVEAALRSPGVERFEVILVPAAQPRTKPKALNYGLQFARGELLTIYDAEDRPDPLQLRRAVFAMRSASSEIGCLQAELAYFNPTQNVITRWFTVEYLMWFTQFLPALAYLDAPVPLGGTSNHFRTRVLREVGGWDPFNVTEDADLGVRLHRLGYRTAVLPSTTLEEANSDFVNWIRQRSRWYKGYLQTWLVHLRHPVNLYRELGWRGFLRFNLFVGGTPLLALLNPVFWAMTLIWFMGHPGFILSIFPAPVYFAAVVCWLFGTFMFIYLVLLCAYDAGSPTLVLASVLTPVYWVMMAVAAAKAAFQLLVSPSYWEKTAHGLTDEPEIEDELSSQGSS